MFIGVELLFKFDVVVINDAFRLLFFVLSVDFVKPLLVCQVVPKTGVKQDVTRVRSFAQMKWFLVCHLLGLFDPSKNVFFVLLQSCVHWRFLNLQNFVFYLQAKYYEFSTHEI